MANNYLTPGVYVQEISTLSGSVVEVASAVPAFIGYTKKIRHHGRSLHLVPERISSFKDFEERFGTGAKLCFESIQIKTDGGGKFESVDSVHFTHCFMLYEMVYMYFANGGGECYVVSTGAYEDEDGTPSKYDKQPFLDAIEALDAVDDVTLLVLPEAVLLGESCFSVQQAALAHCARRMNRFAILDLCESSKEDEGSTLLHWRHTPDKDAWRKDCQEFRDRVGILNLSYGAAYTPYVIADIPVSFSYRSIRKHLKDNSNPPQALSMGQLEPSARKTIDALDTALLDRDNLMDAVTEAKNMLMPNKKKEALPRLLSECIEKTCPPWSSENIQKIADMYCSLFTSLLGVNTAIPEVESAEQTHTLSPDMVRHVADQLKAIVGKYAELSADGKEVKALLESATQAISALPVEKFKKLVDEFQELLFSDIYEAINKNITRLSDGLYNNSAVYRAIHSAVQTAARVLPPSAAMAGIYATTDRQRGVWKAPANVSMASVLGLTQTITQTEQETLNADSVSGKSINALRFFPGKGCLVWGARTLDGNNQEWRYIPVRRLFLMVEESMRRASTWAVFEPNDANLWAKVKSMLDNYLLQKWKEGALLGAAPSEAYFVNVGLGSTMTEQDILEGRLLVDVGMAAVRPAEFIILRFMHKMQQS